jgi:hypothetical protein
MRHPGRALAAALALLPASLVVPASGHAPGPAKGAVVPPCSPHPPRQNRVPGPTRILFIGDSITGNVLVDGNGQALFTSHGFEVQRSSSSGFGLLDDPQHGYRDETASRVGAFDPDVVVLEFIGNYRAFGDPGLAGVDIDTPGFYAAWQAEADAVTRQAAARGARVYWVLGPAVGITAEWRDRVHILAAGYRALATTRCGTRFIDAFETLGDPWAPSPLRNPDGVHLSAWGGAALAHEIFDRVVASSGVAIAPLLAG